MYTIPERNVYLNNTFGLKTLYDAGRIKRIETNFTHLVYQDPAGTLFFYDYLMAYIRVQKWYDL